MLILLRSSLAAKLSPLLGAIALFFAFSRGRPWVREWLWAVQWYNAATFLLGIAATGVAAADLARRSRDGSFDVARPAGTSARLSVAIWASTVVVVVSAYLVGLVAVLLVVAAGGAGGRPDLRGCMPAVLALLAYTALGALFGSLFPGRAVGPLTAVGAAVVTIAVNLAGYTPLVYFGGATVSLVGLELNPPTLLWKSLWALSLTMVCLLLVTRERWLRPMWLAAVLAGGAAVVVTATGATTFGQNDLRLATVPTTCTSSKPVVCLTSDYAPDASQIQTDLEPVLTLLRDRGLPTPERFELGAIVRTGQTPDGVANIAPPGEDDQVNALIHELVFTFLIDCDGPVFRISDAMFETGTNVEWILLDALGANPGDPTELALDPALTAMTPEERLEWVTLAVDRMRQCTPTPLGPG